MIGLTDKEVIINREKYGKNIIENKEKNTFLKLYISSLSDPIIRILLIALGIKLIFLIKDFDWYETIGIVISIFIASFISTISEYGSEKAFTKLQEDSSKLKCKVIRNKKICEIEYSDIVVDDIVILQSGDKIPADGIIIDGEVYVDESSINGESKEKLKIKNDILYKGCIIYNKKCYMKVTKVGINTLYGSIALELQTKPPISPLKNRLTKLAQFISKIGYICAILTSISYLFSSIVIGNNFDINLIIKELSNSRVLIGHILYALTLAVTVIIVAVPEGLPMMITLVLSSNMKKMVKDNVLVRKLVGIETSGSLNILFTDKTVTLTTGKLKVTSILDGDMLSYDFNKIKKTKLYEYVKLSFLNNNESIKEDGNIIGGNSTSRAMLKFIDDKMDNYRVIKTVLFDSKLKYSETIIDYKGKNVSLMKGASEVVLKKCMYYFDKDGNKKLLSKRKIEDNIKNLSLNNRVLVCAFDNILVCIVNIKDEIKKESKEAIRLIEIAHINTIMITGDNLKTAYSIGKEIGLIKSDKDIVITSEELNRYNDIEIKNILPNLKIVARALPSDKSKLVKIAQDMNLVVGMTGDGVNDAPALKIADVGYSMGSGTEVAKEASDIVILDDNLLSISKAILYGRTIYKSIRKFLIFQLSVNLCAVSLSIIGHFINVDTPVTVIQMLWINMVMDTLAGLAFSYEPTLLEYMNELPKKRDESIINKYMINEVLFTGLYCSVLCIMFLKLDFFKDMFRSDIYYKTAFFGLFIFISIFNSFNARTYRVNIFANLFKNKIFLFIISLIAFIQIILIYYGGRIFRTSGLTGYEFLIMILLSLTVIPVDFVRKLILRMKGVKGGV